MELNKYDLNLKRQATIATALMVWKKNNGRLQMIFCAHRRGRENMLRELRKVIVKRIINSNLIPASLMPDLIFALRDIGEIIIGWFWFIRDLPFFHSLRREDVYEYFLKEIYWLPCGMIDEEKILDRFWMKAPSNYSIYVYQLACCYCSERHIQLLWPEVSENFRNDQLYQRYGQHFTVYWNSLRDNNLNNFNSDIVNSGFTDNEDIYDTNQLPEVNMFHLSTLKGSFPTMIYFWNKLNEEERRRHSSKALKHVIMFLIAACDNKQAFKKYKYLKMLLFLIGHVSEQKKINIFQNGGCYLVRFFIAIADVFASVPSRLEFWNHFYNEFNFIPIESSYYHLINHLLNNMHYEGKLGILIIHSRSRKFFREIWSVIPLSDKARFADSYTERNISLNSNKHIDALMKIWDLSTLKVLLSDESFVNIKDFLIKRFVLPIFRSCSRKNNVKKICQLLNEIFTSVEPAFEDRIKEINCNILTGCYSFQNELSEEENNICKSQVNTELICQYFIESRQLLLADKFLNWVFNADEVKVFKNDFIDKEFTLEHIRLIWHGDAQVEDAKKQADEFLLWLLESEEKVIFFKLQKIIPKYFNQEVDKSFWEPFVDMKKFNLLKGFVSWCGMNDDFYRSWTSILANKFLDEIMEHYMNHNFIIDAIETLIWAFDDENKIFDYLGEFALSERGIRACKLFISKYFCEKIYDEEKNNKERILENFQIFVDFFIAYAKDLNVLKSELKKWRDDYLSELNSDHKDDVDDYDEDGFGSNSDYDFSNYVSCHIENYDLFFSVLYDLENKCDKCS